MISKYFTRRAMRAQYAGPLARAGESNERDMPAGYPQGTYYETNFVDRPETGGLVRVTSTKLPGDYFNRETIEDRVEEQ